MKSTGAENSITLWQKKHWTENWHGKFFSWKRYFIVFIYLFVLFAIQLDKGGKKCSDGFQNNKITANVGKIATISQRRIADFYKKKQLSVLCSLKVTFGISQYQDMQRSGSAAVSQQTLDT